MHANFRSREFISMVVWLWISTKNTIKTKSHTQKPKILTINQYQPNFKEKYAFSFWLNKCSCLQKKKTRKNLKCHCVSVWRCIKTIETDFFRFVGFYGWIVGRLLHEIEYPIRHWKEKEGVNVCRSVSSSIIRSGHSANVHFIVGMQIS